MKNFFESDVISRTFTKERGNISLNYKFTTRGDIFMSKDNITNKHKLFNYMQSVIANGTLYMEYGCSNCEVVDGLKFITRESPIINMCRKAAYRGKGNRQHPIVQNYFLYNDMYTVCYELPVYDKKLNRSGFIDLIRYQPYTDTIWILDFKPNTKKENRLKVLSQLYWYRELLSSCTKISTDNIKCAYFDDLDYIELVTDKHK